MLAHHGFEASAIATLARNHPVVLYVFDLLYLMATISAR